MMSDPYTSQQQASMKIISAALGIPFSSSERKLCFGKNLSAELLQALSDGAYEKLNQRIFDFAKNMAKSYQAG